MADKYESQRKAFDSLQKALAALGETLDKQLPALETSSTTRMKGGGVVVVAGRVSQRSSNRSLWPTLQGAALTVRWLCAQEQSGVSGPFDDEETRVFYESLLDVRTLVPAVLLSKGQEIKARERADSSPAEPSSPKEAPAEGEPDVSGGILPACSARRSHSPLL